MQCTDAARENSTLDATLLLDLFEKIVNTGGVRSNSQRAHIEGSLALVKLQGVKNFTDEVGLKKLHRLSINTMISCISQGSPVPPELLEIRNHLSHFIDTNDPKFRSIGVLFNTTTPGEELRKDLLDPWVRIKKCALLDEQLETISLEAYPYWCVFWCLKYTVMVFKISILYRHPREYANLNGSILGHMREFLLPPRNQMKGCWTISTTYTILE